MNKYRVFLGIPIPALQSQQLTTIQQQLAPPGSRPVKQKNFHVTLYFLDQQQVNIIHDLCDEIGGLILPAPLTARIFSVRPFPNKLSHLVAAIVEPNKSLSELHSTIGDSVKKVCPQFSAQEHNKAFRPHITLIRKIAAKSVQPFSTDISFLVDSVCLYHSEQQTDGVQYAKLASFSLPV